MKFNYNLATKSHSMQREADITSGEIELDDRPHIGEGVFVAGADSGGPLTEGRWCIITAILHIAEEGLLLKLEFHSF